VDGQEGGGGGGVDTQIYTLPRSLYETTLGAQLLLLLLLTHTSLITHPSTLATAATLTSPYRSRPL